MTCPRCKKNLSDLLAQIKAVDNHLYEYFQDKYWLYVIKGNWIIEKTQDVYCINKGMFVLDIGESHPVYTIEEILEKEFEIENETYLYKQFPCCRSLTYKERIEFYKEYNTKEQHELFNTESDTVKILYANLTEEGMTEKEACNVIGEQFKRKASTIKRIVHTF